MKKIILLLITSVFSIPFAVSAQTSDDVLLNLLASLEGPVVTQTQTTVSASSTPIVTPTPAPKSAATKPAEVILDSTRLFDLDANTPKPDPQIETLKATLAGLIAQFASISSQRPSASVEATTTATTTPQVVKKKFTRDLTLGSRGEDVKQLQIILIAQGYLFGEPTSYFGLLTKTAVITFQENNGLPGVGNVGPKTRTILNDLPDVDPQVAQTITYGPPAKPLIASSTSSTVIASTTASTSTPESASSTPTALGKPVSVSLSILPSEAPVGGSVSVTWLSQNAKSCEASDGWGGPRPTIGAAIIEPLEFSLNFVLTCIGDGGVASTSALVVVGEVQG